jgi:predicted Zn finger-like uncharacterized protein
MIKFTCPKCGAVYKLADSMVGRHVRCGACGERSTVSKLPAAARTIIFDCPTCKSGYSLPEELAGKPFRCRQCQQEQAVTPLDTLQTLPDADEPAKPAKSQPPSVRHRKESRDG